MSEGDRKRDDDEVWRDIVARWEDEPAAGVAPDVEATGSVDAPSADSPSADVPSGETWNPKPFDLADEGTFVPPTPPPVQLPEPPRLIAWSGVIGAPALFVIALIAGVRLPSWASTLLVCSFIGGFVFLVATMRNEPRDPGDDGAVV